MHPKQNPPTTHEKNEFYSRMNSLWKDLRTTLSADRPPDWEGYRFEATVEQKPGINSGFSLTAEFGDLLSNRQRGGVPKAAMDQLARIHMAHMDFWPFLAWKTVVIEQSWNSETKSWGSIDRFTY